MKRKILNIIKNPKTKYIVVFVLFAGLMMFSERTNVFYYYKIMKEKKQLEKQKQYYLQEIEKDSLNNAAILKSLDSAERFGREKYLMKKENEDIFIIRKSEDSLIRNNIE